MALDSKDISTGKSFSLAIVDGSQNILSSIRFTQYNVTTKYNAPESQALDGISRRQSDIAGYECSFTAERTNNFVDQYLAVQQANFLLGGVQYYLSGTETIAETDGTTSQYIYEKIDLQFTDLGDRDVKNFVFIKGNFHAALRSPSASNS